MDTRDHEIPSPKECEIESLDDIQLPLGPDGKLVPFSPPPRPSTPPPPPPGLPQSQLLPYSLAPPPQEPPPSSPPPDSAEEQVVAYSPRPQQEPTALDKIEEPTSPDSPLPQPPPSPPDSPQAEEPPPPQKQARLELVYTAVLCVIVFTLVTLRSRNKRGN